MWVCFTWNGSLQCNWVFHVERIESIIKLVVQPPSRVNGCLRKQLLWWERFQAPYFRKLTSWRAIIVQITPTGANLPRQKPEDLQHAEPFEEDEEATATVHLRGRART